ncbi:Tetratricopeptide repeat protein [Streptomyces lavendulae subsp. lavendulae]|uniref:Tetratricopeptide repeat protein n=3 Tax=Streptomyces lavendulae TaxID=1914 RepID=A0A2K8PUN9_STRLA|nr:Tetratricopeptide repeat protein [Streptomyces lavendulae subsp. lavendulae]ATZ29553.1 Tetratricopeptide repeat protein [Streptomyces lavendulae subsp. lavendulae]
MGTTEKKQDTSSGCQQALRELQARFTDALAASGLTVTLLARNAGLGRTTVSNALNRPVAPKARTIAEIARVLKLNPVELQQLRRQAEGTDTPQATSHAARKSLAGESASAQAGRQGLLVGALPLRASAFQSRPELRERIDAVRMGGGVVLTQARPASAQVLSGMGGVGKSQLATQYAHQAVAEGTGLVLWVPASEAQQIVTIYSQAALRVGAAGATGEDPEYDARALLEWLATTSSSWLVVLDDISDPVAVGPWWPPVRPGVGWTLATTRLHDPRLTGGGRTRIDVGVYTHNEAVAFLEERLASDGGGHLLDGRQAELAAMLGHLPLALGHAAAYLLAEELACGAYLARLDDQALVLDDVLPDWADTELYGQHITAALLLSLAAAQQAGPVGLVEPLLRLLALLDPDGHPEAIWTTQAVTDFLNTTRGDGSTATATEEIIRALRVLRRYALITSDPHTPLRQIRMHALTARAVRETTPCHHRPQLAVTVAHALTEIWKPGRHIHRDLAQVLRANTAVLRRNAEEHLWQNEIHVVIFMGGLSLLASGLHRDALDYWAPFTQQAFKVLGPDHPDTIRARAALAGCYRELGRYQDALTLAEQVLTDCERLLEPDHPGTIRARANLASAYNDLGRYQDALTLAEQVLTDRERVLRDDHPDTIRARANLAIIYNGLGRYQDALTLAEQVLTDRERHLEPDHPHTILARANLATTYRYLGRHQDALTLAEQVLTDRERVLGDDHPDTLLARSSLATTYSDLGRHQDALTLAEQVLTDHERVLGEDHFDTIRARANLASAYNDVGRHQDALTLAEQVLTDRERHLEPDHPHTFGARANLATTYRYLRRHQDALTLTERMVADCARVLGDDHPDTLLARSCVIATYSDLGRHQDALTLAERVVADYERVLGDDHPDTLLARSCVIATYSDLGRHQDALTLAERVVADYERVLGDDHPDTLLARSNLATAHRG